MQPLRWERRPDGLRAPALVCAFKGWNDAGESASSALTFMGASLDADALRDDRPRGVRRLPGRRARPSSSSTASRARSSGPSGEVYEAPRPARAARPDPALRPRAVVPLARRSATTVVDLAEALGVQLVVTLGALLADVPHSRPVSVTGLASDRGADRAPRPAAAHLRGPDRDRRRAARRLRRRRHAVRARCGRPSRTTSRSRRTRRARSRSCASSRRSSASPSTRPSSRTAAGDYERQVSRAVELDPDVQAFVERLERAADEEEGDTDPDAAPLAATSSRASSSASCASAAAPAAPRGRAGPDRRLAFGGMSRFQRQGSAESQHATSLELFYDLVFVFAITQVSHLLLGHLTWAGAGQSTLILLVVWWAWNYTTWVTNELDPESTAVRLLLIAIMLASLLIAIAIPEAFGSRALPVRRRVRGDPGRAPPVPDLRRRRAGHAGARARRADPDLVRRRRRAVDRRRPRRRHGAHAAVGRGAVRRLRRAARHLLRAGHARGSPARRGPSGPRTSPSASSCSSSSRSASRSSSRARRPPSCTSTPRRSPRSRSPSSAPRRCGGCTSTTSRGSPSAGSSSPAATHGAGARRLHLPARRDGRRRDRLGGRRRARDRPSRPTSCTAPRSPRSRPARRSTCSRTSLFRLRMTRTISVQAPRRRGRLRRRRADRDARSRRSSLALAARPRAGRGDRVRADRRGGPPRARASRPRSSASNRCYADVTDAIRSRHARRRAARADPRRPPGTRVGIDHDGRARGGRAGSRG